MVSLSNHEDRAYRDPAGSSPPFDRLRTRTNGGVDRLAGVQAALLHSPDPPPPPAFEYDKRFTCTPLPRGLIGFTKSNHWQG